MIESSQRDYAKKYVFNRHTLSRKFDVFDTKIFSSLEKKMSTKCSSKKEISRKFDVFDNFL